jgi:hypothetical protein
MFRDLQCNRSDQSGAISVLEGISAADDRLGATVAGGAQRKVCIPIFDPLVGAQAKGYFPLGLVHTLRIELEMVAPADGFCDPAALAANNTDFRLTDVQYRAQIVELSDESERLVAAQSGASSRTWSTTCYSVYNDALPVHAGNTTVNSIIPSRFSSIKSIYSFLTPVAARNVAAAQHTTRTKQNMTTYHYNFNGKRLPQRPVDTTGSGAMALAEVQRALHAFSSVNTHSSIGAAGWDTDDVVDETGMFLSAIECESYSHRSDAVFSGISTLAQPPTFEADLQCAQACHLYHVVSYDCIVQVADGNCSIMS